MKEALLYKKLKNKEVQCNLCSHRCTILPDKRGICGVRENKAEKLHSLVYGKACAEHVDPIEKKPLFHFLPGTTSLSVATVGCNFRCKNCQNWETAQSPKENGQIWGEDLSPEEIVKHAKEQKCHGVSYTYTEPTIFIEYALDTMKLAKAEGLKNSWVTNGFMTKEAFELVAPYLDGVNCDLKSFTDKVYQENCGARVKPVLETLKRIKKAGIWLEVTTLIIPTLNDKEEEYKNIASFIKNELGPEVPWHISQFYPAYKLMDLPATPVEAIHKARDIGKKMGLKYVYTGNLPGDEGENTYCPKCDELVIERLGYSIKRFDKDGKCSKCGEKLDLILK